MRKNKRQARVLSILAIIAMTFSLILPSFAFAESDGAVTHSLSDSKDSQQIKINNRLQNQLEDEEKVTFLIKFTETTDTLQVAQEAKEKA